MPRIIEKILERREKIKIHPKFRATSDPKLKEDNNEENNDFPPGWYYSFEFFPPKTEAGLENLLTRIDRMTRRLEPLFIDITWGSAGSTQARTMSVASHAQRYCGVDVLMHLTTTGMTRDKLSFALQQAKACGVNNILALRGDPPRGKRSWKKGDVSGGDCDRAIDLVRLIRELHGDFFGIAVAGHPEGHPSSYDLDQEIMHLKEKIEAGADFIITQFFYDVDVFLRFVKTCREYGITCPIIPGIMPIQSYSSMVRMVSYCKISVPKEIMERLEPVKHDDEAVKEIGCQIAVDMCKRILSETDEVDGAHFYTLNLERSVTRILMSVGAIGSIRPSTGLSSSCETFSSQEGDYKLQSGKSFQPMESIRSNVGRPFPWRPSAMAGRSKEEVRPINWANRPKSYVMRTEDWDEFPNGRWGDSTSPAFGELSDFSHFYSFSLGSEDDRRAMLGQVPREHQDVFEIFARYVEGTVPHIPWCESELQPESFLIQSQLAKANRAGYLTINSQPSVNGVLSTNKIFGWGGPGGVVYQKSYCECFCSPENTSRLVEMVKHNDSMNLYAVNNHGKQFKVGVELGGITALTWGVFPNREILQPTVFDPSTFLVWAEEAFSLWTTMWLNLYEFDSQSYELIENIRDTFFLVAIIDNNFFAENNSEQGSAIWKAMLNADV